MWILIIVVLLVASCQKDGKKTEKQGKADDAQPVMIEELSLRPLNEYIQVSGKLEGIVDITMNSETSGRLLELYKKLGDKVNKGERLGRVDNEVFKIRLDQAEAALLSAQAGFENAQKNANYAESSFKRNLISELEYNSVLSSIKGAKAGLDGAKAGVEAARNAYQNSFLTAPESGTISNIFVSVGQVINPNQAIASITDASTLILKTGVGETQISKIKVGQNVEIEYPGLQASVSGKVRGFGIRPLIGTATYPIEIELKNPGTLMPGMVASAKILSMRYQNLLYTAITNVVKQFDRNYIYIVNSEGNAERRMVELGNVIGENVVLASGAEIGEKIVISGTENLEDGSKVQIRQ